MQGTHTSTPPPPCIRSNLPLWSCFLDLLPDAAFTFRGVFKATRPASRHLSQDTGVRHPEVPELGPSHIFGGWFGRFSRC